MIRDRGHPVSFLTAAKEAVFLLIMATGLRVDDLYKLGKDFRWENQVFVIPFLEKRKCKVRKTWTRVQRIAPDMGSRHMCPVTALFLYSTFAVRVQDSSFDALFVSSTGQKAFIATLG
jgi:hypothetical protein